MRRLVWVVLVLGVLAATPADSGSEDGERELRPPGQRCGGVAPLAEATLWNQDPDGSANYGANRCEGAPTNCPQ